MPTLTFPLDCFVGLAVGGAEVTVPGYARQPITLATCVDGVTLANLASAQWQAATQSWGVIDTVLLWDAATGGTKLLALPAETPVLIAQYDGARIPASGLQCRYTDNRRPFGRHTFGTDAYGKYGAAWSAVSAIVDRVFTVLQQPCATGLWGPSDDCEVGTWTPPPACSTGAWTAP